ncbi:2-oxoisovalerate dehydrogenase E2 component (dihydrolipoyl transacylase) [Ammoniphilus resinae]|uniref:Dihydrolipoamide acetyltransferase component of pyruvate dehydrogenase complex n=1 Tax=Ammoniphilus resinae TaxID=861532 RepID=A0ABS4GTG8_9BACL|nr:2-oxoisovalerate dehydrogenase E2 component (dihydrolipoyl transacylase) [Ammoniphilus resinae]
MEKIFMPQLGESVTEGTISKWLVRVGDQVSRYDPLCEVSTDKVNAEVPSVIAGRISEIVVAEGETVAVGALICYIEVVGEKTAPTQHQIAPPSLKETKPRYSPAVLRIAQDHQIDLVNVTGTGAGGRITRKDVLAYLEGSSETKATVQEQVPPTHEEQAPSIPSTKDQDQIIPINGVRKTIAERMVRSKQEAPHAWMVMEADVTNLVTFRERKKSEFMDREGFSLTYLPFFIKAVVEALKEYPMINSEWTDQGIVVKKEIHISIAVATEDALFVPVIRDADQKSIYGLAREINQLVRKTREGKLTVANLSGGTFTVNNTGAFGSVISAPILNPPQAAIMSVEKIVKKPVVIDNMIALRDQVNLCLSLDHRVLDGLVCGRFLQSVKRRVESYGEGTEIF